MSVKGMLKTVVATEMQRRGALNSMQLEYLSRALETMFEEGLKAAHKAEIAGLLND